ncbi:hypothetical protein B296_00056762 [Ensete ventricosum]|uniref:Uncharacterized protein n=1 Tax=Ensete ventricosum TaxID=4639 RepID=A0A426XUJ9_ENSVE|nr:hypothetical protein B296_00056762 [Ensete ventricosum]
MGLPKPITRTLEGHAVSTVGGGSYESGGELEEEGADDSAEQLRDPVEKSGEDGDLPPESQSEGYSRVHVAAGDVGGDRYGDEEGEPMDGWLCIGGSHPVEELIIGRNTAAEEWEMKFLGER